MNKLVRIIDTLSYKELIALKKDLLSGNLDRLINKRLERMESPEGKVCAVCNSNLPPNYLTLTFGPPDFRKRAYFCALDCLEYFINKLKEQQLHKKDINKE